MQHIRNKLYVIVFVLVSFSFYSLSASASFDLCLKKEISADGVAWYDANVPEEAVMITDGDAHFRFTITKCPDFPGGFSDITLVDPLLNLQTDIADLPHSFTDFPERIYTVEVLGYCDNINGYKENIATVEGLDYFDQVEYSDSDNAWANCLNLPQGGEGCTPGYWKQDQHLGMWPIATSITFREVFDRIIEIRIKKQGSIVEPTLLEVLHATGGQVNMAARHAAAAYLNAVSSGVNFDMSMDSVVEAFQNSFDTDNYNVLIQNLVDFNEQDCPLN